MKRFLLVPFVALFLVASVITAPVAAAYEPPGGPVFNNPKGDRAAKFRIVNTLNKAIRNAPRGSTVLMSAYLFDNGGTYDALVGAWRRGAHVKMVLDGKFARNAKTRRLAAKFNRDNTGAPAPAKWGADQSYVVFCRQACRGPNGYNHTKLYAFSQSGTARNVVMTSSSNPNAGGAVKGWNDMFILKGKPQLFAGAERVVAEMAQDTANDGDGFMTFREGGALTRYYPKRSGTHPIITDLNQVRCAGGTVIRVSMFRWNRVWGKAIARKLVSLAGNGCKLKIVYGAPSRELRLYLTNAARRSGRIDLWDSRFDRNGDGKPDLRVHHKYLLISGANNDWEVTAGSQNWGASLRTSDENTVTVHSRGAHAAYARNFAHIVSTSARRIG